MKKMLSVEEVHKITGLDPNTIREGIKRGELPIGVAVKASTRHKYIIPRKKLEDFWGEIDESKI